MSVPGQRIEEIVIAKRREDLAEKAQMKKEKQAKQEHNRQKKLHRVVAPKVFAKAAGFGMSSERQIKEAAQLLRDDGAKDG